MRQVSMFMPDVQRAPAARNLSEYSEFIGIFFGKVKRGWDEKRYGPLTMGRITTALQGIPVKDFYYIKKQCEEYEARACPLPAGECRLRREGSCKGHGTYARAFFGMLKARDNDRPYEGY